MWPCCSTALLAWHVPCLDLQALVCPLHGMTCKRSPVLMSWDPTVRIFDGACAW